MSYIKELLENRESEWLMWENHVIDRNTALYNEADKYNDILFFDIIDVYRNLTLKMLQFYKWLENISVKKKTKHLFPTT